MDKLIELIGKILEKLTSAKLLWTLIIAIVIFGLAYFLSDANAKKALSLDCLTAADLNACTVATWIGVAALAAISLILSGIIIWIAGLIKNKYFV